MRWLLWFVLVPQLFLVEGWLRGLGVPPLDVAVCLTLFCVLFAQPRALAGLVLGIAMARAVVLDGGLAVHILAMGTPVAVLLPLRGLLVGQRWLWQCLGVALLAVAIPKLDALYGELFAQPQAFLGLDGFRVLWSVLLLPPVLLLLRRLPPLRAFHEVAT